MKPVELPYQPVEGKTYTLFGNTGETGQYYQLISVLTDTILDEYDPVTVLQTIRKYSPRNGLRQLFFLKVSEKCLISFCLELTKNELSQFTAKVSDHLKHLSIWKFRDRRLFLTEGQYHLFMLEIELTNRLNKKAFLGSDRKISLQPYCLQDFAVECKAAHTGFDYQCKRCSGKCYQNRAGKILEENHIEPYIWMGASISKAAKEALKNGLSFGILGIACIPELVWGLRKCSQKGIPAVGIPLNANRCARWFGEFHHNSVDLTALKDLITY